MPNYDYECRSCGENQEITLPSDYKEEIRCGHCGNVLFKIFSANPIHFKGTGWGKDAT
jgi:putative FmdB family regulatory protein